jgi:hypothetical protein
VLGIWFDLSTQATDQRVDRSIKRRPSLPFHCVHDGISREYARRAFHKELKQVELRSRQLRPLAINSPEFTCGSIKHPISKGLRLMFARSRCSLLARHWLITSQDGTYTGKHLSHVKRLGDVVIGTKL